MFVGTKDRLVREMTALISDKESVSSAKSNRDRNVKIEVIASSDVNGRRQHAAWMGGSIMAAIWPTYGRDMAAIWPTCITREEYEEVGPAIVHRK